jgi:hypothetical protein
MRVDSPQANYDTSCPLLYLPSYMLVKLHNYCHWSVYFILWFLCFWILGFKFQHYLDPDPVLETLKFKKSRKHKYPLVHI